MKILGTIITVELSIALVGLILKLLNIPGAALLLILGLFPLLLIMLIQFIMSFIKLRGTPNSLMLVSALMSFTLFVALEGILLRYMWWPGWQAVYLIATPIFIAVSIPAGI